MQTERTLTSRGPIGAAALAGALAAVIVLGSAAPSLALTAFPPAPTIEQSEAGPTSASFRRHFYRGQAHHGQHDTYWRGLGYGGAAIGAGVAASDYLDDAAEPSESDAAGYCASRFKSYDPASGTYLGYDGNEHPCP